MDEIELPQFHGSSKAFDFREFDKAVIKNKVQRQNFKTMCDDSSQNKLKALMRNEIEVINTDNTVIQNQEDQCNMEINSSDDLKPGFFHTPIGVGRKNISRLSQRYKDHSDLNSNFLSKLHERQDLLESQNAKLNEKIVRLETQLSQVECNTNIQSLIDRIEKLEVKVSQVLSIPTENSKKTDMSIGKTPRGMAPSKSIDEIITPKKGNLANVIKGLKIQLEHRSKALKSLTGGPRN
jgi:hypothetical protein